MRVRGANLVLALVLAFAAATSVADDAVVLVVGSNSPIAEISLLDIRKAYLGISVVLEGNAVRPLRRRNDERINLIFLQSVIAMSEKSYERRLLSLMLKFGTPRPEEIDGVDQLFSRLTQNSHAIAYMWRRDAEADSRVKVIRVLWQEH